jgi:hypothetical protein
VAEEEEEQRDARWQQAVWRGCGDGLGEALGGRGRQLAEARAERRSLFRGSVAEEG